MARLALLPLLLSATATAAGAAENVRPFFQGEDPESTRTANVESPFSETFQVVDPDGDPIEVSAEGLPPGARLRVRDPRPWREEDGQI